jgi:hypothetical protein
MVVCAVSGSVSARKRAGAVMRGTPTKRSSRVSLRWPSASLKTASRAGHVGHRRSLPARHFGAKTRIAGGEILGAVVALPAVAAAGAHAPGRAPAFVVNRELEISL